MDLGPQLWIGEPDSEPSPDEVDPIENVEWRDKPTGGFWTSTETDSGSSEWIEWCQREDWWTTVTPHVWRLQPSREADVLHVVSVDQLLPWTHQGRLRPEIDWEALCAEYDGVHITGPVAHGNPFDLSFDKPDLHSWDCESTLWSEWAFTEVEYVGKLDTDFTRNPGFY